MNEHPWWPTCIGCGRSTVDPSAPPRYDVLSDEITGPYDVECFASTETGRALADHGES